VLNSDAAVYGGSNVGNLGGVTAEDVKCHNQPCSAELTLPPLSILAFKPEWVAMAKGVEPPAKKKPASKAAAGATKDSKPAG